MLWIITFLSLASAASAFHLERIIGGEAASPGQFPHQGSLQFPFGGHTCGCSLIGPNKVITAAHCIGSPPSSYRVLFGLHQRLRPDDNTKTYTLSQIVKHPGYKPDGSSGFPNDVAVMITTSNVETTDRIQIIALADSSEGGFDGTKCFTSGWGLMSGGGAQLANTLRFAEMNVISNDECAKRTNPSWINDGHICVYDPPKGGCNGDSGGPLVCDGKLAGVTSWVMDSCSTSHPTVFARVSYFKSWVDSVN